MFVLPEWQPVGKPRPTAAFRHSMSVLRYPLRILSVKQFMSCIWAFLGKTAFSPCTPISKDAALQLGLKNDDIVAFYNDCRALLTWITVRQSRFTHAPSHQHWPFFASFIYMVSPLSLRPYTQCCANVVSSILLEQVDIFYASPPFPPRRLARGTSPQKDGGGLLNSRVR
jgi:hypothetical protein